PAERMAHRDAAGRLLADAAIHRRDADAPEGLVARARGPLALVGLPGLGERRLARERGEACDDAILAHLGRADAAGRIDVDVGDATAVEVAPVAVDVPSRARVTPMRVAGPEADSQAAAPVAALLG